MSKEIDEQSAEELEKTIAATAAEVAKETPPEPPKEEPKPEEKPEEFVYEVGGTTYKGKTEKEVTEKVLKALGDTKAALGDRERQIYDLKHPKPAETKVETPAPYDHKKYLELLEADSWKAHEYQKEYDPEIRALREARAADASTQQVRDEVVKFYRDVPDYAKVETKELNDLMKERLAEKGRGFTAEAMGLTYYELREEGKIPKTAGGKPVTRKTAMPDSPSGTGEMVEGEPDYDNMSSKELVTYMKKNKVPGAEYLH